MEIGYHSVTLRENVPLGGGSFVLVFDGCEFLDATLPGQFVMLRAEDWGTDPLLPRAFSLLSCGEGRIEILIKATGKASAILQRARVGASMQLLGPLGNSFPVPDSNRADWLVAGGVGLAPLLMHAQRASKLGLASRQTLFYGGRSATDLVLLEQIRATGVAVELATNDGSEGLHGMVTQAVERQLEAGSEMPVLLACGPDPMLEAVAGLAHRKNLSAYLSLEGEMACGIGACLACAVPCHSKPFRYACVEGPVMELRDLGGRFAIASKSQPTTQFGTGERNGR